jgi:hypothetical protein
MASGDFFTWIMIGLVLTVEARESPPNSAVITHNVESNMMTKFDIARPKAKEILGGPS